MPAPSAVPGCPRFGETGIAPVARAQLEELASAHDLPEVLEVSGTTTAFRLRARLAIRGRVGSPKLGCSNSALTAWCTFPAAASSTP